MAQHHHDPAFCTALGKQWIDAWNSHDLERVLALYADETEMTSDKIPLLGFDASGTVRGKDRLRQYWTKGLGLRPHLRFTLIDVYVSPDSLVVLYANELGGKVCEYLRLNSDGKIRQGSANHPVH